LGVVTETTCVAIVDDDVSARTAIHGVLKSVGFNVTSFASAEEFLASHELRRCACLITDLKMPGMNGLELQQRLAENRTRIPIIFVSAYGDDNARARAMKAGAVGFLDKPFNDDGLIQIITTVMAR